MATKVPEPQGSKIKRWWTTLSKKSAVLYGLAAVATVIVAAITVHDRITGIPSASAPASAPQPAPKSVESLVVKISSTYFHAPPTIPDDGRKRTPEEESQNALMELRFNGYYEIEIENVGPEQVDSVLLTLPHYGVARIRAEGKPTQEMRFGSSMNVGSIAPSRKVSIQAWTGGFPFSDRDKEIRVTHSKGVGRLEFVR